MKKLLTYLALNIPLYILCAVCCSCAQQKHQVTPLAEELILLDDSLFFIPEGQSLIPLFEKLDSFEHLSSLKHDHASELMAHHIRADLHIIAGHNALAFNEARKLIEISDCNFGEGIYFLTLSNIDIELNLFGKARERLLDALQRLEGHRILQTRIHLHLLELNVIQKSFNQAMLRIDKIERLNAEEGLHTLPHNIQIRYAAWKSLAHLYFGDTAYALQLMQEYEANEELQQSSGYETIKQLLRRNYHHAIGEHDKALYHAKAYINECQKQKNRHWELNAYMRTGNILEEAGKQEEALPYYRRAIYLKDSLTSVSMNREEVILKEEQRLDELEYQLWTKRHDLLKYAFVGGVAALLMLGGFIFNLNRQNRKLQESTQKLKAAQKRADESIQAKSLFLSNMSHEIRTPLNAISGFSEILISQPDMDQEMRGECNNIIRENSMLLLKLLNDVLDLSNLDIENMNFSFDNHDVVSIGRSLINMLQSIKHSSNASILFETEVDKLVLHTDENRLRQLLINLLINATKFTKEGNITLSISVDKQGENALFAVTDTGCGIPLEKQKSVFSRFEKLNENVSGTGLGLSICQSIIHRLGGDIWIDSSYNKGARFVFSHPIPKV
ncbi:MAG: HAMP domain-containing histidine kinase [Bacteroidaceae bacterium]|nr:HAMP domain-containing histidine kinase [Bacteroidaceae bacterium]